MNLKKATKHWLFPVGLAVAGVLYFSKGAIVPAITSLIRIAMPFVIVYLVYWIVRNLLYGGPSNTRTANPGKGTNPIIDLCPKCGEVQKPGHNCRK